MVSQLGCVSAVVFANALLRPGATGQNELLASATRELIRFQDSSTGAWPTLSEGERLSIETTAMAVHALATLKPKGYERVVRKAAEWLRSQQRDAHWSSDEGVDPIWLTVLVLDALELASVGCGGTLTFSPSERMQTRSSNSRPTPAQFRFDIALSFAGESRSLVNQVADTLAAKVGGTAVFYDEWYKSELARPNLDQFLQSVYFDRSRLIVVFMCEGYERKEWCGLEWRAIRDLIKRRRGEQVMFLKVNDCSLDGVFSIDGYIDCRHHTPPELADFILERLSTLEAESRI